MKTVKIKNIPVGLDHPPILIAGPCVLEDEELALEIAVELKKICTEKKIPLIFKASYIKANRSSGDSYVGPGLEEGVKILLRVKEKTGLPILTDIHETSEIPRVSDAADILQIPAFLCRQTGLVKAAARTKRVLNVKKGQFMSPNMMKHIAEKAEIAGNNNVILTERGTFFGYGDLVVDMRSLAIMGGFGYPVLYDATHSVQQPGGLGDSSGGLKEFILPLAKAAAATGFVSGIYAETHPEPAKSPSDSASMMNLDEMPYFIDEIWKYFAVRKQEKEINA